MSIYVKNTNYLTLDGVEKELKATISRSEIKAELVTLGHSVESRSIYGVCFGDGDYRKPEVLYLALTHSMEYIGTAVALGIVSRLASKAGARQFGDVLKNMNVWVIPVLNPDGYVAVEKSLSRGLGFTYSRKNARGVDLNRNFPVGFYNMPLSLFAGSPLKASPYFRGAGPCSEAEAQVLRDFILGRNIKTSINLHSFGSSILIPYHHTKKRCKDHDLIAKIADDMASMQERPYEVKQGWQLYTVNGDVDDWFYDECKILPFTFEIGKLGIKPDRVQTWMNPFYWSNPISPVKDVENVLPAALHLIEATSEMFCS